MAVPSLGNSLESLKQVETIVYVMMENRSFDHMMGHLSLSKSRPHLDVNGLQDDPAWLKAQTNAYNGQLYPLYELDPKVQFIQDPPHEYKDISIQIRTPRPDGHGKLLGGFVKSYVEGYPNRSDLKDPSRVMGYYPGEATPVYDFFALNYVVCDQWYSALPASTQPNRLMAMSGESKIAGNASGFLPDQPLVYDWLEEHAVKWCCYQCGDFLPFFTLMKKWTAEITTSLTMDNSRGRFRRYADFPAAWVGGEPLPQVIFIEPEYTDGPQFRPNDDHSPSGIAAGQEFMANLYSVLISNPERWAKTLLVITYDEHGGFFDHVPPLGVQATCGGHPFATTGLRVPAFLVSPWTQTGSPFKEALDHTSFLQLLADRFNPGQSYSSEVGKRQTKLARLATALLPQPRQGPPVAIPQATMTAVQEAQYSIESPIQRLITFDELPNVLAFHNVAKSLARSHSELLQHPSWSRLQSYVSSTNDEDDEVYA